MPAPKQDFAQRQKQFNDDLSRGRFARVYLLCGDQSYLRLQNRERLGKALLGDGDEMNLSRFSGQDVKAAEIMELAETLPFFADRRVIFVESTGWLDKKANAESDAMADMLAAIPDSTSVVFVEETVDKRKKLYKAIKDNGFILDCDTPDETTLKTWAGSLFRREGITIEGAALALFLEYTGEDMQNIASEAEKLICYSLAPSESNSGDLAAAVKQPRITREEIRKLCTPRIKDRVFEMVEAMASRDRRKALKIYMDLLALRTAPQIILTLMIRQYMQLLQVQEMSSGKSDKEIAAALHLPPFVITKKYKPALRSYSHKELLDILDDCLDADQQSKSGKIDAGAAVELLLVRHAGRKGEAG